MPERITTWTVVRSPDDLTSTRSTRSSTVPVTDTSARSQPLTSTEPATSTISTRPFGSATLCSSIVRPATAHDHGVAATISPRTIFLDMRDYSSGPCDRGLRGPYHVLVQVEFLVPRALEQLLQQRVRRRRGERLADVLVRTAYDREARLDLRARRRKG
jgi:hypothetical protein